MRRLVPVLFFALAGTVCHASDHVHTTTFATHVPRMQHHHPNLLYRSRTASAEPSAVEYAAPTPQEPSLTALFLRALLGLSHLSR